MVTKSGQIAVFVIIGLAILMAIGLIFMYREDSGNLENPGKYPELVQVENYVSTCLQSRLEEVVNIVTIQGGYYSPPEYSLESIYPALNMSILIPFYIYGIENILPTKTALEQEIADGIKSSLYTCTNFSQFSHNVETGPDVDVHVSLNPDEVLGEVEMPIAVKGPNFDAKVERFNVKIKSDIYRMYLLAANITLTQQENGNLICMSCLSQLSSATGLYLDSTEIETRDGIVIIYKISNHKDVSFNFAHRIMPYQEADEVNIESIGELNATITYPFEYHVNATGTGLNYSVDSTIFNINSSSGLISFTPEYGDAGSHLVTVTVVDAGGNTANELFMLHIEDFGSKPRIEYIGCMEAEFGEQFIYDVNATSDENLSIAYFDNSDLFDINYETGVIEFIPESVGDYGFNITAIDIEGRYDIEEGCLIVI